MAAQDKKQQERNQEGTTNTIQDPQNREHRDNSNQGQANSDVDHKSRGHNDGGDQERNDDNGTQGRNAADSR